MEDSLPDNTSKLKFQSCFLNNKDKILLFIFFILSLVAVSFSVVLLAKNRKLNKEIQNTKFSQKYELGVNLFNWAEGEKLQSLYLSPSLLKTLKNDSFKSFSCLDFIGEPSFDTIKESLSNNNLKVGLEKIEDYVFTKPLADESQNPLPPTKSKYEIAYTNICNISENKYVVLFLTTQEKREKTSLIQKVQAAGGWLGDSHMALIDGSSLKIYERFPFDANLINLPKEGKDDLILRFGAYYNCGKVIAITDEHIVIKCSRNIYSYDSQNESFQELAICGSKIEKGSYMTGQYSCFDTSGNSYLNY